jgi:hypothetical protein
MGELKPDRFYEALEVQNGRLLAEIARLQAERDALARDVRAAITTALVEDCPRTATILRRALAAATSSPSASGPS